MFRGLRVDERTPCLESAASYEIEDVGRCGDDRQEFAMVASTRDRDRPSEARPRLGAVSFLHRFGSALNHHVHLHVRATDGVFVPTGDGPPALLRASCLPKTVAGSTDHPGGSGHAHRESAPSCRALVPHAAAPRRRCGRRHARSRKQWVLSGHQRPDHALTSPSACLVSASQAPAAMLCPAALRAGAALRDPRRRRPHQSRPLRAATSQGGQLGRPGGMRSADMRRAEIPPATAATHATNRPPTTPPDARGQTHGPRGGGVSF